MPRLAGGPRGAAPSLGPAGRRGVAGTARDWRSQRLRRLSASVFSELDGLRRRMEAEGARVIDLGIGSPDLPPAPAVVERLRAAAADPAAYRYPLAALPRLHEAIAGWYRRRFGVVVDPEREVLPVLGSQEGIAHLCLALLDAGDVVLTPDPGYPLYTAGPVLAGAEVLPLPLLPERGFLPDLEAVPPEALRRARLLLLNYPANPVTAVADLDFFREAVAFAARHGLLLVHDAAYSELAFDGRRPPSVLQVPGAAEVAVEFNSLSKAFSLAGCRIGYGVGNAGALAALREAKSHLDYGIFRPVQEAAIAALEEAPEWPRTAAATYQRRRDVLVSGLRRAGWEVPPPPATMFCWAPLPPGWESRAFARALLERAGVLVVPGLAFGARGEGYVRIALVRDEATLAEAAERVAAAGIW